LTSCCSGYTDAADAQFGRAKAKADLARYRRHGPNPTTRMLANGVRAVVPDLPTLLDVGAGVGALAHELLDVTSTSATLVEASSAYLRTAQQEAERRGQLERCAFHLGDFVDLAPGLAEAAAVTMDRVVCCYHAFGPLLDAGFRHAQRAFAYSYPRDRWYVRLGVALENFVRRLRRSSFRMAVHPPAAMQALAEGHGFELVTRQHTLTWCVEIWKRRTAP